MGARPFIGIKLGKIDIKPEITNEVFFYVYKPVLESKKMTSIDFDVGTDYVDENLPFVFGVRFIYTRLDNSTEYLSKNIFSISLVIGTIL